MTPKAGTDLDNIYGYISEELFAVSVAANILERLEKGIMRLKEFPFSCNCVTDEFLRNKGYIKLIVIKIPLHFKKAEQCPIYS